jgi:hypothetical protein
VPSFQCRRSRAVCTTYDVVEALRVREFEDEGSSYYLRLSDGRVLFLTGQYMYEYEDERAFPCTRFTLERAPESQLFLALTELGPPLAPSAILPPFTEAELRAGLPADGALLELDFESLRAKGGAQAAS